MKNILTMILGKVKSDALSIDEAVMIIEKLLEQNNVSKSNQNNNINKLFRLYNDWEFIEDKLGSLIKSVIKNLISAKENPKTEKKDENKPGDSGFAQEENNSSQEYGNEWLDLAGQLEKDFKKVVKTWMGER